MRVTSINSNATFGYNKELHSQIQKKLETTKSHKTENAYLLNLEHQCIDMEDTIIGLEDRKLTKSGKYGNLACLLSETKKSLMFFLEFFYPQEHFCDKEIQSYIAESKQTSDVNSKDWRIKLCRDLSEYSTSEYPELKKKQNYKTDELSFLKFYEDIREIRQEKAEQPTQTERAKKAASSSSIRTVESSPKPKEVDILNKFEPTENSPKGLDDVVGLDSLKESFQSDIIYYLDNPEMLETDKKEYGIQPPKGYLLYGPPGCGKTYIAKALAQETGLNMYQLDVSKAGSKYVNQTSNNIQKAFDFLAERSKYDKKPVILFMDEIDSLALSRNSSSGSGENHKTTGTLLKLIESSRDNGIIVIATTNMINSLDEALKQRFDKQEYVGLPKEEEIQGLLNKLLSSHTKGQNLAVDEDAIKALSGELVGHSNRTIDSVVNSAYKIARNDNRSDLKTEHIMQALSKTETEKPNEQEYQTKTSAKANNLIGFKTAVEEV